MMYGAHRAVCCLDLITFCMIKKNPPQTLWSLLCLAHQAYKVIITSSYRFNLITPVVMGGKVYRSIWSSVLPAGLPPRGLLADWTGKRSRSLPPSPACLSGCCREGGPGHPPSGAASPGRNEGKENRTWERGGKNRNVSHQCADDLGSCLFDSAYSNNPTNCHWMFSLHSITHRRPGDTVLKCNVQFYLNVGILKWITCFQSHLSIQGSKIHTVKHIKTETTSNLVLKYF